MNRYAFSLMELLICITIIALVMAILLPSLRMVREAAYTTRCLSNLRQMTAAGMAFSQDNRGLLPPMTLTEGGDRPTWRALIGRYVDSHAGTIDAARRAATVLQDCPGWRGNRASSMQFGAESRGQGYELNRFPGWPSNRRQHEDPIADGDYVQGTITLAVSQSRNQLFRLAQVTNSATRLWFSDGCTGTWAGDPWPSRVVGSANERIEARHPGRMTWACYDGHAQARWSQELQRWNQTDVITLTEWKSRNQLLQSVSVAADPTQIRGSAYGVALYRPELSD